MKERPKPGIRYTFGRYKGELVSHAPKTYARWAVRTFVNGLPTEPELWKAILKRAKVNQKPPHGLTADEQLTETIINLAAL